MISILVVVVLLSPFIANYTLIPIYFRFRYKHGDIEHDYLFIACLWAIGLLPFISYALALYLEQEFPQYAGGGEPGLNFGYDDLPLALGPLLIFVAHITVWVLLAICKFAGKSAVK